MGVSMRRWMVAAVAAMAALTALAPAAMAQTNLIPGGLTAVPPTALSPNLAQNPGFEANSGGVPTGWTGGGGWALDQQTTHSGAFSYRWSNGPSSDQPIFLKAGIYNFSAWIKTQGVGSGNAGLRLQVDFRPGGVGQWFTTDPIQGTADWTLYQIRSIVVPQDLQAALRLENFGGATGRGRRRGGRAGLGRRQEPLPRPGHAALRGGRVRLGHGFGQGRRLRGAPAVVRLRRAPHERPPDQLLQAEEHTPNLPSGG